MILIDIANTTNLNSVPCISRIALAGASVDGVTGTSNNNVAVNAALNCWQ